MTPKKCGQRL